MFLKDLSLDVIATFDNCEQDHFQLLYLQENDLKTENNLLTYIKNNFDEKFKDENLLKLSLCWISKNMEKYKKFEVVRESIKKRGKYFFESKESEEKLNGK